MFGEGCDPVGLLEKAQLLKLEPEGSEWVCELFAKYNAHLAGDFKPPHMKGNQMRQVGIHIRNATLEAPQLALLIPEKMHKPNGEEIDPQELDRAMVIITTFDKIFQFTRNRTQITETLVNAALVANAQFGYVTKAVPEELRQFINWFLDNRTRPRIPQTTEQVLADMETLIKLAK